jgi:adenylate cyclase
MSFFRELRRRKVFRVGAAYTIVAWLLIQIAVAVFPTLQLPSWSTTLVTVLLMLGFPVALLLAWAFELTPEGIRPSQPASDIGRERSDSSTSKVLDYALLAGLLLVAGATLFTQFRSESTSAPVVTSSRPSVAVLPFKDLSPEGDQEYFGDGMAEELLNEISRLDGLDVASRTSTFAFKGSTASVPEIGRELGVGYVFEGSIRKKDDEVRVTAQLIKVADGYHVWSQTYDRPFMDVFRIQEEISRAIAGALGVQFGIGGINAFRGAGTQNVAAYDEFLRALATANMLERARILEHVVEMDPEYAVAWAELGLAKMSQLWNDVPSAAPSHLAAGLPDVERAAALDPASASAHSMLGSALYAGNRWSEGQAEHERAIALRADFDTLAQNGNLLFRAGRLSAALAQFDAADQANPLTTEDSAQLFRFYSLTGLGRFAEARSLLGGINEDRRLDGLVLLALSAGTSADVRTALADIVQPRVAVTNLYEPLLKVFDDRDAVLALLRIVYASERTWPSKWHDISRLAAYFGDPDFALEVAGYEARYVPARNYGLWMTYMSEVRKLPGFKQLMIDIGLVDYWREYGWADLCQPVGATDFVCS